MTEKLSSWFEKGRPALFDALENVCRQIDTDIRADLEEEQRKKTSVEVEPPQGWANGQEGVTWKWQHCKAGNGAELYTPPGVPHTLKVPTDDISRWRKKVPIIDWKAQYAKLQRKYIALDKNYKAAKDKAYKLRDQGKEFKEQARVLHELILAAEQEHGIQILGPSVQGTQISRELQGPNVSDGAREGSFSSVGILENTEEPLPVVPSHLPVVPSHEAAANRVEDKITTSDIDQPSSTQAGSERSADKDLPPLPANDDEGVPVKEEPSSDGPVFVSERCTNKRKRDGPHTATPIARVKTESGRSSPEMSMHRCDFDPQESIDLGEAPSAIWTPRKRRQMEIEGSQRMMQSVEGGRQAHAADTTGYASVEPPPPSRFDSALTPINVNRRLPQAPAPAPAPSDDKPLRRGLTHGIQDLAEDGGFYKRGRQKAQGDNLATTGRLDSLLNSPSIADDPVPINRPARRRPDAPTTPQVELGVPSRRALPFDGTTSRASDLQTPQSRPPLADTTNTFPKTKAAASKKRNASPKKAPGSLLRNKPVAELRAEDFKINPQANKGHDYAFSEVVRDKDERAVLPGCVDEHCCGPTFRGLAESEYPDDPSIGDWRQNEQKLLEEYLGDYSYRLTGMSKEERKKLWIEARMQKMANKHGKHKHHTARMRSPPGFWQFDFPTTQEIEEERAEAARREKQKVQERHREAMRSGGRWLFRDE